VLLSASLMNVSPRGKELRCGAACESRDAVRADLCLAAHFSKEMAGRESSKTHTSWAAAAMCLICLDFGLRVPYWRVS
jgi:hypothetical protein